MGSQFDSQEIRKQFPVLAQEVNGHPLIYLDNAATMQKPQRVLDALHAYYTHDNANIHRAAHTLASRATEHYETTRKLVRDFIRATEAEEIIFTKGVTESINLVATSWGRPHLGPGDEVLISGMEHHSNIVPWQMVCAATGASLKVIPVSDSGELVMEELDHLLSTRTRIVSVMWASNTLGTVNPVNDIIDRAHAVGALVMLDAAQAGAHIPIDVQSLDVDFLTFSSHKSYGPTGVGVLYGKRALLEAMPPYQGGGEMIREVRFEATTYNDIPYKFEAGTPNIADVIAFGEAIRFITETGQVAMGVYELSLLHYFVKGIQQLNATPGKHIRLIGTASEKVAVQSFLIDGMHPFDTGMLLDAKGIAVRTGHHCTQPLMQRYGIEGTVRASFAVYNTFEEVDQLLQVLAKLRNRS